MEMPLYSECMRSGGEAIGKQLSIRQDAQAGGRKINRSRTPLEQQRRILNSTLEPRRPTPAACVMHELRVPQTPHF